MKKLLFILLLIGQTAIAQTRIYLSSSAAAPYNAPFDGSIWATTTGATRFAASTTKDGSTMTTKTSASGGINVNVLICQHVFGPLAAQTILNSGTFKVQSRRSSSVANNNFAEFNIYVVSPTGTIRGYIAQPYASSTATTTTLTNRGTAASPQTISGWQNSPGNITVTQGDYLVIEQGGQSLSGSKQYSTSIGSDNATDLPADETTTTANNPWVEFSQTINLYTPPATGNKSMPVQILMN